MTTATTTATTATDNDDDAITLEFSEEEAPAPRCEFITGSAGTGKTYLARERIANDPSEGVLCATTGIAAVNLGTITINSLLKYFDTDSLTNNYISGKLVTRLAQLAKSYRNIYIDEVSMMAAEQLDVLYQAVRDANWQKGVQKVRPDGMGIIITGDMCQLPPIKERWIFEASCWPEFAAHTTTLTKNWRQGEGEFLTALNALRRGDGVAGARGLTATGAEFAREVDRHFPGTTIISRNDEVDRFNWAALQDVKEPKFTVGSRRWYQPQPDAQLPPGEWKQVPNQLELKVGAYVMILANSRDFKYANGDCGWVRQKSASAIHVELVRNGEVVEVGSIDRNVHAIDIKDSEVSDVPDWGRPWWDEKSKKAVIGTVRYVPLRLAYASTVHKSQGLTLDRAQIDIRNQFFGKEAMAYVAVSRCRSAEGLRIIGSEKLLAERCRIDERIRPWI